MRPELAALRRAGITRARFSARYAGRSRRGGYIMLSDVQTPIGGCMDHAWIRPWHWHGPIPAPGDHVEFRAQIEPYFRDDGTTDLGLFRLEVL